MNEKKKARTKDACFDLFFCAIKAMVGLNGGLER